MCATLVASMEWGEEWQLLFVALDWCADTLDMFLPVNGFSMYSLASCIGQARPVLSCKSMSSINVTYIFLDIILVKLGQ